MNAPELPHRFPPVELAAAGTVALETVLTTDAPVPDSTASPTVLFVDQSGQLGGAELSLLPLAARCAARSEVLLLSDGPFRARLEALGVRVRVTSNAKVAAIKREALRLNWLRAVPGILAQVRTIATQAKQFDVLFLNTQKALVLGALGKPLHRRPVIWHVRDIMSRDHFGQVQLRIVRWLVRHAVDLVVANSRASADALTALTGLAADAVPVVHNGIDASAFAQTDASDIHALRRRLGLPEDAWLAGLFGRLAPWKGQHIAIEALAKLPGAHLVLVGAALFGEDAYAQQLHRQAEELGVADRVHFAGFRDDMPAWMKAMDVILHTSTEPEPFGRVIIEGMAAGRPVVAAAAGGVLEIVRHRENGWLVQPGDVAGLVNAIETLRDTPALAQQLAEQAYADVQLHFSLDSYLQQMSRTIARMAP
ncbi:glycosyltransferase family 4 protein [Paraburkholderia sp. Tr-20389]|uniref:glycosyltransferase family 4 protein n=1 Tax=Paraburkholderia sp. Tr-20389 TaxID=2703903 RepID=UPI001982170F|nr:glycosyltransferase family 4 protein [Paraburkholderia sp. Tr-20389]MBN3757149.1 glycosyltransferase family 4 protein [Paraburkholderia sp. Tr-20389]